MATEFASYQSFGLSRVGRDAGTLSEIHAKTAQHCRAACRLPCYRYGMICYRNSLIRQSCYLERDFDRVLLQLVDILTPMLNTEGGSQLVTKIWAVTSWPCDELTGTQYREGS